MRRRRLGLLLLPLLLCSACAEAILSRTSFRSHDAYSDEAYAAFREILEAGGVSKGEALATLGPPIHVIPRDLGEVFVYRRLARDTDVLNLNPAMVSGLGPTVPIPIYFDSSSSGRNDTLMLFFDAAGRLVNEGRRFGIDDGEQP